MNTETIKIRIKKSANHLAWSNRNVGKILIATKERTGSICEVRKEDNPDMICNDNFISGFVYPQDYEIVN